MSVSRRAVRRLLPDTLRLRVLAVVAAAVVMPMALAGALLSYWTYQQAERQSLETLQQVAAEVEAEIRTPLQAVETQLRLLDEVLAVAGLPPQDQERLLETLLGRNRIYQVITLVPLDADLGTEELVQVARTGSLAVAAPDAADLAAAMQLVTETDGVAYGTVQVNEQLREPLTTIAAPLHDERTREVHSVVVATIRFMQVWDLLGEVTLPPDTDVYVIDEAGMVIAHRNPTVVLAGTTVTPGQPEGRGAGIDDAEVLRATDLLDIEPSGLTVVAERPTAVALATAVSSRQVVLGATIAGLAGAILLAGIAARAVLRPIEDLAHSADRIAGGDIAHRADESRPGELGVMARSFNTMTDRLEETIVQLEERVRERTAELEQANADKDALIEQLSHRAARDFLTDLPNRYGVEKQLESEFARVRRANTRVAVHLVDLDNFKDVNDTFGHAVGDDLLVAVARRLTTTVRDHDVVGRLGGDEFLVVQPDVRDPVEAAHLAQRILDALSDPFEIGERRLALSGSVGVALSDDARVARELMECADLALYRSKLDGRNTYRLFERSMQHDVGRRVAVSRDIGDAVGRGELHLEYQPLVRLLDRSIAGVEALLRWRHPRYGDVSPREIVTVAESTGHFAPVGRWVVRAAVEQARRWQERGVPVLPMSVNIAGSQVRDPSFVAAVGHLLESTGLTPDHLQLEFAEEVLLDAGPPVHAVLDGLAALGVRLAIDGFGRSHAAISLLSRLPLSTVKIDSAFLERFGSDDRRDATVRAIVDLTSRLHLELSATGVEAGPMLESLRAHDWQVVQGHYFSPPLDPDALEALVLLGSERIAPRDGG